MTSFCHHFDGSPLITNEKCRTESVLLVVYFCEHDIKILNYGCSRYGISHTPRTIILHAVPIDRDDLPSKAFTIQSRKCLNVSSGDSCGLLKSSFRSFLSKTHGTLHL